MGKNRLGKGWQGEGRGEDNHQWWNIWRRKRESPLNMAVTVEQHMAYRTGNVLVHRPLRRDAAYDILNVAGIVNANLRFNI